MKEFLVSKGFRLSAVAKAISVQPHTITNWRNNAPIGKLIGISEFTGIPMMEIIDCFEYEPTQAAPTDRTGGEENN